MTEIPEHLLKRSQAAKAKAAGAEPAPEAPAPAAATPAVASAATPAPAAAAKPAKAEPPAPVPDIPVVAAYKARKKIPVWAMVPLSILPVWMFMYLKALTPEEAEAVGPVGAGAEVYSNCASCHGGGGEGTGAGRQMSDGEVIKTFPHIEDQLRFVALGTDAYALAGVDVYGNPDREGGPHITKSFGVMPGWQGALTDAEILEVVCHERYTIGGLEEGEEFELWCSETSEIHAALVSGANTFADLHEAFPEIIPIGTEPVPGSPPSE